MTPRFGALAWVTLALCLAAVITIAPLLVPLIFAAWAAIVSRPLLDRLAGAMKGRSSAAAVMVLALVLVVVAISSLLVASVVSGSGELWTLVSRSRSAQSALQAIVSQGGDTEAPRVPQSFPEFEP